METQLLAHLYQFIYYHIHFAQKLGIGFEKYNFFLRSLVSTILLVKMDNIDIIQKTFAGSKHLFDFIMTQGKMTQMTPMTTLRWNFISPKQLYKRPILFMRSISFISRNLLRQGLKVVE